MTEDIDTPVDLESQLDPEGAETTDPSTSTVATLQEELARVTAERDSAQTDFLRARADFQNFKRRTEEEREQLKAYLTEDLIKKLLPIVDNFERALQASAQTQDHEKLMVGINAIHKQFAETLTSAGVQIIPGESGTTFDPNLHNAVLRDDESGLPENTIVEELQRGYSLGGKVLRPTLVKVATGG